MPSEPEKKIEPLLNAYAKNRRQAATAGTNTEPALHPATRRVLQSEVRRRWPAGSSPTGHGRSWFLSLKMFWPRLAAAGGLTAVLAGAVWMMIDSRPDNKFAAVPQPAPQPEVVLGQSDELNRPAAPAAVRPMAAPSSPTPATPGSALNDPLAKSTGSATPPVRFTSQVETSVPVISRTSDDRRQVGVLDPAESAENLLALAPSTPAAASAPLPVATDQYQYSRVAQRASNATLTRRAAPAEGALLADAVARSPIGAPGKDGASRSYQPTSRGTLAASADSAAKDGPSVADMQHRFRNVQSQSFGGTGRPPVRASRPAPGLPEIESSRAASPAAESAPGGPDQPPVFASFVVQQNGSAIRVVDADGSIYAGQVTPAAITARNRVLQQRNEDKKGEQPLAPTTGSAASEVSFEVAGTNETLRQPVFFAGTLFIDSTNSPALFGQPGSFVTSQAGAGGIVGAEGLGWVTNQLGRAQILRVQGHGRFGTNPVQVDAVPAPR